MDLGGDSVENTVRKKGVLSLHFDDQIRTPFAQYAVPRIGMGNGVQRSKDMASGVTRSDKGGHSCMPGYHWHTQSQHQPDWEKKQQMAAG